MTTSQELPLLPVEQSALLTLSQLRRDLQDQAALCKIRTPAGDEAWLVTRHAELKALSTDPRLGRSHADPANAPKYLDNPMLDLMVTTGGIETEREDQVKKRALYPPSLSARRVLGQKPRVEAIAAALLEPIIRKGPPSDLHTEFTLPYSRQAMCEIVGVPLEDRDRLIDLMEVVGDVLDREAADRAMTELFEFATELSGRRRLDPGDDVISRFMEVGLGDQECGFHAISLMFGGLGGTLSHVDFGILLFAINPDQRDLVINEPKLMPQAVDEVLRTTVGSPVLPRYALEDIDIAGVTVRVGELVMLDFSLANYDPRVYQNPDKFDVTRAPNPHFTFGHGIRHCIGASLARIVLNAAYTTLLDRLPGLRLAVPLEELHAREGGRLAGGLGSLPIAW